MSAPITSADVLRLCVADSTYEKRNEKWVGVGTNLFRGWTYGINPNECQLLDRIASDAAKIADLETRLAGAERAAVAAEQGGAE